MVESTTKDHFSSQHLLDMIDKGRTSTVKEAEPVWKEPMPAEADLAAYLEKIKDSKSDLSV